MRAGCAAQRRFIRATSCGSVRFSCAWKLTTSGPSAIATIGVILAGGSGRRMAAGRNKALLTLAGRPLLLHSINTFLACCDRLLVVAAEADLPAIRALLPAGVALVAGGPTRHGSEANALAALRRD